jgi:prepilin-type N-terminal cleavage/methylation domain-containing protein
MQSMRRPGGFTLIELLAVLTIIGMVIGMVVPNVRFMQNRARTAAVQMNMRAVAVAITAYYAENGHYADDFYEDGYGYIFDGGKKDELLGKLPTNPFSGRDLEPDEFNVDEYDQASDATNTLPTGPNDEWGFVPGEMRYSSFTPDGHYYPTIWGLIGFDAAGRSIRQWDSDGNEVIFVLN